jgi:hypothetical protein
MATKFSAVFRRGCHGYAQRLSLWNGFRFFPMRCIECILVFLDEPRPLLVFAEPKLEPYPHLVWALACRRVAPLAPSNQNRPYSFKLRQLHARHRRIITIPQLSKQIAILRPIELAGHVNDAVGGGEGAVDGDGGRWEAKAIHQSVS